MQPGGAVRWVEVPDPSTAVTGVDTRDQVPAMTKFRGGEGIWYARGSVYEISGPFRTAAGGVPRDFVFGPPAGEVRPNGPLNPRGDGRGPGLRVHVPRRVRRSRLARRGLPVRLRSDEPVEVSLRFLSHDLRRRRGRGGSTPRPVALTLAKGEARIESDVERQRLRLRRPRRGRKRMRRRRHAFRARLIVSARDGAGNRSVIVRRVRVGRARRKR